MTIVVLHTYGHDAPFRAVFDAAFAGALRDSGVATDLYVETFDPNRFRGEAEQQRTRAYLQQRFSGKRIAIVVAVFGLALDFVLGEGEPLFPGVPVAAVLSRYPDVVPQSVAFIWSRNAIAETVRTGLRLHPLTRQIVVIDGGPVRTERDALGQEIRDQIASVGPTQPVIYLRDLPLDELLPRVRAVPPDSLILVVRQILGRGGAPMATPDALREIASAAAAPVYITTDQQMGTGAVGGVLISSESLGRNAAQLTIRAANAGAVKVPPVEDALIPMFDWRQLRRWAISESALPANRVVLFRQLNVWELYRGYVVGAAVIVVLQTALIAGLVVQGIKRRRSERALRAREQDLRQSYEENRDLAGRLINAQEAERTRLARELHDDVSQQLAALSIVMSGLRQKAAQSRTVQEFDDTMAKLQERTASLAQGIRALSHQLHPSVLQHTGLMPTLQRHCAEVAQQYALNVRFSAHGDLEGLDPQKALCLFRVAQEAIHNAVRHAKPRLVTVQLSATVDLVELQISDEGVGFLSGGVGDGLGLRSMDERARLVGGRLTIDSRPGHGTLVHLRVPRMESDHEPVADQDSPTRSVSVSHRER